MEALDSLGESLEMLTILKRPRVWAHSTVETFKSYLKATKAQPLNNIGGLNLRPNAQNTATISVYVDIKFNARPRIISMVMWWSHGTIVGKICKLEPTQLPDLVDGGLQRQVWPSYLSKWRQADYYFLKYREFFLPMLKKNVTWGKKWLESPIPLSAEIHSPDIITLIEVQDENGSVNDGTTKGVKSGEN